MTRCVRVCYFNTWARGLEDAAVYVARAPALDLAALVSDPRDAGLVRKARERAVLRGAESRGDRISAGMGHGPAWLLIGVAMGSGLYEAAFSTLVRLYGSESRGAITGITLIAGLASTVGWPLSALMEAHLGWRGACLGWAALHLSIGLRLNSHSRLNLIIALQEAIRAGADEALMLDPDGYVSSCNATNLFWVRDGEVRTSTGAFCFNGVTRANVIRLCEANGIPLRLGNFPVEDVREADEAFVTGTFGGLTPVREIDGRPLPQALPGYRTTILRALYEGLKDAEAAR
eukprot:gene34550-46365_t